MNKKLISIVLSLSIIGGLVTGCNTPVQETAATAASSESTTQTTETEAKTALPMDPSGMKPWINSNIMGMAADEDMRPDLKDDFYFNVNFDYLRDGQLRPGYSEEAPFFDAMYLVRDRCFEILNDDTLTGDDAQRVQAYYELWLDWDSRNEAGIEPILPFIDQIKEVDSIEEMNELLLSEENHIYGVRPDVIEVMPSYTDSSLYEVWILSTSLSLSDAGEYREMTESGRRLKERRDSQYSYMLSRVGYSDEEIEQILTDLFEFETAVAANMKSRIEWREPNAALESINPATIESLREMSPNYPLADYMEKYGWAESDLINVDEPKWLEGLNALYTEENLPGIKAYILTQTLRQWITFLDEDAYRKNQEYYMTYYGITEDEPDEDLAYEETRAAFPNCFARLYIDKYLNEETRNEITQLCQDVADTYKEIIMEEDWMSDETKEMAVNKLSNLKINAVYPDKWPDDSMYKVVSKAEGGTYFQAVLDFYSGMEQEMLSKINTKVDSDLWTVDILETNAFYDFQDNSINIIPGFFCSATYRSDMSVEELYGTLGTVIGHEISHAFDSTGSRFDANGNVNNWWTDEDLAAFDARSARVAEYFDGIVAFDDGTVIRGQLVQGESIADLGSMKCILKMAGKIDGFDYDQFFRAYANLWAGFGTIENLLDAAATDSHAFAYLRANVVIAQFDEFIETYDIHEGNGMYIAPEDRILVW
ncbi:MAG: M13 family metallopeptidase [Erysipelotrichaceae bacterium]|nr:M13 family metallopeptidase [Erysipelotrichaceae bacterium]